MARPNRRQQVYKNRQARLKVGRHGKMISRFRGRRARGKEIVSRIYSERWETRAVSPMVAYKPYATEQLPSHESTAIYNAEYSPNVNMLTITFWGYKQRYVGDTYDYFRVPYDLWVAFMEASSKGRFFYYHIRSVFSYRRR